MKCQNKEVAMARDGFRSPTMNHLRLSQIDSICDGEIIAMKSLFVMTKMRWAEVMTEQFWVVQPREGTFFSLDSWWLLLPITPELKIQDNKTVLYILYMNFKEFKNKQ